MGELVIDMARVKLFHSGCSLTLCRVAIDVDALQKNKPEDMTRWSFAFELKQLLPPGWKLVKEEE